MSGSRFFSPFFVDDGALMMVASMMVPSESLSPFGFKMSVDLFEDPLPKVVGFKKMAEERRCWSQSGTHLVAEVYSNKASHGSHVARGLLPPPDR